MKLTSNKGVDKGVIPSTIPSTRAALARLLWAEIAAAGHRQCDVAETVGITEKHLSQMINEKVGCNPDIVDAILRVCRRRLVLSTEPITDAPGEP